MYIPGKDPGSLRKEVNQVLNAQFQKAGVTSIGMS